MEGYSEWCMCVCVHRPLVDVEGVGGGSVQLLTGGRRVSQASPTLSPAILEPSFVFRHRGDWAISMDVEIHGLHQKSNNSRYWFSLINTELQLSLSKNFIEDHNANFS